jgi:malate permease and related proteins
MYIGEYAIIFLMDTVLQFIPLIAVFLFGFLLRQTKQLNENDGSSLLKLVFYVGMPALIFLSILRVEFDSSLLLLSLLAPSVVLVSLVVLFILRKSLLATLDYKVFGALLTGVVIMNTGFLVPFVEASFGAEGLARLAVIDAVNAITTVTLVYAVVVSLGREKTDRRYVINKLLVAPPLWALILALICKTLNISPSDTVMHTLDMVAGLVSPTILIALGLKFTLKIERPRVVLISLLLRFGLGAAIGIGFIKLFGLSGIDAQIVLFACLAPIGFNSITFSELEKLDIKFAASQVSVGLLIAMLAAPVILYLTEFVK